jgi:hypothetical protein
VVADLSAPAEGVTLMTETDLTSKLNVSFTFFKKPSPLPADLRPEWRIAVVLLTLRKCRGNRVNLKQLHVMNSAMRTRQSRQLFKQVLKGHKAPEEAIIRFEPSLNRAVDFAVGEGLLAVANGNVVTLTSQGEALGELIDATEGCFEEEKAFLQGIPGKISQRQIDALLFSDESQ